VLYIDINKKNGAGEELLSTTDENGDKGPLIYSLSSTGDLAMTWCYGRFECRVIACEMIWP